MPSQKPLLLTRADGVTVGRVQAYFLCLFPLKDSIDSVACVFSLCTVGEKRAGCSSMKLTERQLSVAI